jgi:hypothetical protein
LALWQVLQINQHGEVVPLFWFYDVGAILALEYCLRAILDELLEALDLQRDEDLGLALRGRDVEGDAVEIGYDLVNVGGRSSVSCQLPGSRPGVGGVGAYPAKRSLSNDSMRTFW